MLSFLRELMGHSEWANAIFFHTWGKSPARDHEELRQRVGHIIGVQSGFLSVVKGQAPGFPPAGPPSTYDELKARAVSSHSGLREFTANLTEDGMARKVQIPWIPDPPCIITVGESLVQAAMHSQHHRGQCMTRLKDFGGEPKNVDWIIWLWKQRPEARWS
jgi:uncharacterized damage-inducible protein DinB